MAKMNKSAIFSLIMAILCFAIALLPILGVVIADDPVGRFIFAGLWAMLGIVWIGNYRRMKNKGPKE